MPEAHQLVTEQVQLLFDEWESFDPHDVLAKGEMINCGECGDFADTLVERLFEKHGLNAFTIATDDFMRDLCSPRQHRVDGVHIWTYVPETGRHYDSEAPEGVADWMTLPFFVRWAKFHKIERAEPVDVEAKRLSVTALAWKRCREHIRAGMLTKEA